MRAAFVDTYWHFEHLGTVSCLCLGGIILTLPQHRILYA